MSKISLSMECTKIFEHAQKPIHIISLRESNFNINGGF